MAPWKFKDFDHDPDVPDQHIEDRMAAEAVRWLREVRDESKPFALSVWFHEPHTPIASPPELIAKYQRLYPDLTDRQAEYFANVENLDEAVGRLLTYVSENNLDEETLVFFTSDNGPLNLFSRKGLRGKKSNLYEGGHRVPGIFRWTGKIPAGRESSIPISGVDFLPTICELVDVPLPSNVTIDGTSVLPLLLEDATHLDRHTYIVSYECNYETLLLQWHNSPR